MVRSSLLLAVLLVVAGALPAASTDGGGRPVPDPPLTAFSRPPPNDTAEAAKAAAPEPPAVDGLVRGEFAGMPAWLIHTPEASAAISVFGGQLLSFVPRGGTEVFWLSPLRAALPTPIRGGVPVCWPYFGTLGQMPGMPAHGLVRDVPWTLRAARDDGADGLVLELEPAPAGHLPLRVRMEVRIGKRLVQTLVSENVSDRSVVFTEALHNYFRVDRVTAVRVEGVAGLAYLDKREHGRPGHQLGPWRWPASGYSDRIYIGTGTHFVLDDPGLRRRIRIDTSGSHTTLIWNPGPETARYMPDVGPHWPGFLAVETANITPDAVRLAPGERHRLQQVIEVEKP